ncbi:cation:proton antiporter [Calorimonas adulescens]|uniref:Cation:proton antiporter n=1 Tax=Calorimonas adulescens TaxID=2606906 RepID=A0A5D8QAY4_9THEO|nr:cation:proton antiporter [Calorimonas adulescens]TZE81294.1 cation:proton antiporter [Calorimonas adulescens]
MTLLELAIVLGVARLGGYIAARFEQPNVLGQIIAGIIVGPSLLNIVSNSDILESMAEIGVILLMFLAGTETNLDDLVSSGVSSTIIAIGGVFLPFVLGFGASRVEGISLNEALFIGTILTATSVSISVQTLREIHKLNSKEGIAIMGAAVIDDVIGIIFLTVVVGYVSGKSGIVPMIENLLLFFTLVIVIGFLVSRYLDKLDMALKQGDRIVTIALVFCFVMSYIADKSGIATITGAYIAGIILSTTPYREKVIHGIDPIAYLVFTPIFFVSIGLKADIKTLTEGIVFSLIIIAASVVGKIIGCGLMAKAVGFDWKGALSVGIGMIPRGEVALIIVNLGLKMGIVTPRLFTTSVLVVLVTTLITPPLLKMSFSRELSSEGE